MGLSDMADSMNENVNHQMPNQGHYAHGLFLFLNILTLTVDSTKKDLSKSGSLE